MTARIPELPIQAATCSWVMPPQPGPPASMMNRTCKRRSSTVSTWKKSAARIGILMEVGRRRLVGGQEDLIIDIALDLAAASRGTS